MLVGARCEDRGRERKKENDANCYLVCTEDGNKSKPYSSPTLRPSRLPSPPAPGTTSVGPRTPSQDSIRPPCTPRCPSRPRRRPSHRSDLSGGPSGKRKQSPSLRRGPCRRRFRWREWPGSERLRGGCPVSRKGKSQYLGRGRKSGGEKGPTLIKKQLNKHSATTGK